MNLINLETGELLNGIISQLTPSEIKAMAKNESFIFDWSKEKEYDVFIIKVKNRKEILGLVSIKDFPQEARIHINLIESSKEHRGKHKKIDQIPACLITYVCKLAFEKGYGGFVSLLPKTQLFDYYRNKLGFIPVGKQMAIYGKKSGELIRKYWDHE